MNQTAKALIDLGIEQLRQTDPVGRELAGAGRRELIQAVHQALHVSFDLGECVESEAGLFTHQRNLLANQYLQASCVFVDQINQCLLARSLIGIADDDGITVLLEQLVGMALQRQIGFVDRVREIGLRQIGARALEVPDTQRRARQPQ